MDFKVMYENLLEFCKKNELKDNEVLKWIIVKTLRLKRDQFDKIRQIDEEQYENIQKNILRYTKGESLGKIFGYIEFCGNQFNVTENVFDPRLSTESLVTSILNLPVETLKNASILDLCTGSGCVAITLSIKLNKLVEALDISPYALEVATKNAKKLKAKVKFIEFDLNNNWKNALKKNYDIIVSNPPYWNTKKIFGNPDVVKDNPIIGFDGGEDGLKYLKLIIENSYDYLNKGGLLFLEIDPDQKEIIKNLLKTRGFKNIKVYKDYRNNIRVIYAQK